MTWTKTGDDFPDQLLDLSDAAYRLHHATTTYSNRVGLDGRIPKARMTLVPVPARTRRRAVLAELVDAGLWADDDDAWQLLDYFDAQLSAEEVRLTTEYNRVRQAIRLAKDDEKRASFKDEERTVLVALQAAREHRRGLSRSANRSANHIAPLRPVPVPTRSAPERERGRGREEAPPIAAMTAALVAPPNEWRPLPTNGKIPTHEDHIREYEVELSRLNDAELRAVGDWDASYESEDVESDHIDLERTIAVRRLFARRRERNQSAMPCVACNRDVHGGGGPWRVVRRENGKRENIHDRCLADVNAETAS